MTKQFTKEALAAMLNGREYGEEITEDEEVLAKAHGLLVIFGASDDLVELRGAIEDDVSAYDGATFGILDGDLVAMRATDEQLEVLEDLGMAAAFQARVAAAVKVEAVWGSTNIGGFSWTYRTNAPHATFVIREKGQNYCRGIVIDLTEAAHGQG